MVRTGLVMFYLLCFVFHSYSQHLNYYLPKGYTYDTSIPVPSAIIHHEVGEWHVTHDRLVNYMQTLDKVSGRLSLQVTGYTYERRPQVVAIITSPANHARLERIRQQHLQLSDPARSASVNIENMPAIVWIGASIHGNESSGVNASLLAAYHLTAATGPQVEKLLEQTVILLDPAFNPDGMNRFASWVNSHKSKVTNADPQSRELNEPWPGGRFNHYWFDLNRDWLPAQHVESVNRLKIFHDWKPNILTDHHEMGTNASFFFQPGVPSRVNPNTPEKNQELTGAIAKFHARNLDSIGSLYFTKEGYDDFYYGKGSTYPDINGSIGILFEQASSRGHAQESNNGVLTFPFTIRNQFVTMLSTLDAAQNMRTQLLNYQRNFYHDVMKEATAYASKAFVFGDANDRGKTAHFLDILRMHKIDVYDLKQATRAGENKFTPNTSYVVPTNQPQFKIIKTLFEKTAEYKDSLFYDVTSWTFPLAFNMPYTAVANTAGLIGNKITSPKTLNGAVKGVQTNYAYAFSWDEYHAPRLLYALQAKGLKTKIANLPLEVVTVEGVKRFGYGAVLVPVAQQEKNAGEVFKILSAEVQGTGVDIFSIASGLSTTGIDIGSNSFQTARQPKIMMLAGSSTSPQDAGEIWHLLDQRFKIPVSIVETERFSNINLSRYNVIIMPSGSYNVWDKAEQDKIRTWVSAGGILIATEDAVKYLATAGLTKVIFRNDIDKRDTTRNLLYHLRSDEIRARDMTGSIFEASMDLSHPLCYGYHSPTVSIFKSNRLFMDQNNNPYDSPVMYGANPLQSGYMFRGHTEQIKNSAVINIDQLGNGKIISMVDNLNFRAFWFGTSKMFMNAIFFGDLIRL